MQIRHWKLLLPEGDSFRRLLAIVVWGGQDGVEGFWQNVGIIEGEMQAAAFLPGYC